MGTGAASGRLSEVATHGPDRRECVVWVVRGHLKGRLLGPLHEKKDALIAGCLAAWHGAHPTHGPKYLPSLKAITKIKAMFDSYDLSKWVAKCIEKPASVFEPAARVLLRKSIAGDFEPLASLKAIAKIKAMINNENISGEAAAIDLVEAATWLSLE